MWRVHSPLGFVGAVISIGLGQGFNQRHHEGLVLARPLGVHHQAVKGWETLGANSLGGGNSLAVTFDLGENRVPDEGGVDVATLPSRCNFWRPHVHHVDTLGVNTLNLHDCHQLVVRRRHKGRSHFFAFEVFHTVDASAIARDQRFSIRDVVQNPEQFEVLTLAGRCSDGAGAGFADLHATRGHGLDDIATAAKHTPVNFVTGGFFQLTRLHDGTQWHQHVLVRKCDLFGLCISTGQAYGKQQASEGFGYRG